MNEGEIRLRAGFGGSSGRGKGGERQKNLRKIGMRLANSFYRPKRILNNEKEGLE
jgi:hypothetical protein